MCYSGGEIYPSTVVFFTRQLMLAVAGFLPTFIQARGQFIEQVKRTGQMDLHSSTVAVLLRLRYHPESNMKDS